MWNFLAVPLDVDVLRRRGQCRPPISVMLMTKTCLAVAFLRALLLSCLQWRLNCTIHFLDVLTAKTEIIIIIMFGR